ncbi:MAG: YybH family protein [Anaerolineae bacterium]
MNKHDTAEEVRTALHNLVDAISHGDLEGTLGHFWDSPDFLMFTEAGDIKGSHHLHQAHHHAHAHGESEAIDISHLDVLVLTPTVTVTMFHYGNQHTGGEHKGRETFVWQKLDGNWKIVRGHVSKMP